MITTKPKTTRLNIRATQQNKELIAKAAEKENKNISDFVLENALSAAEAIVVDDANFTVDNRQWEEFLAKLDAPPRDIPSLRKLLTEPGVFDAK